MLFTVPLVSTDYFPVRGQEREDAVLVTVALSGDRTSCGRSLWKNSNEYVYTYRVDQPRESLPPTFQVYDCPGIGSVGDTERVARAGTGEDADVYLDPFDSFLDVLAFSALLAGAVGAAVFLWSTARDAWRRGRHAVRWGPSRSAGSRSS